MTSRRRKILDLFVAQALPMAASLAMLLVTASMLGPAGRGDLALIVSTATLLSAIGFMSLHVGGAHGERSGDLTAPARMLGVAFLIALFVLVAGAAVYLLLPAEAMIGSFDRTTLLLSCVGASLSIVHLVVGRTRQGLGESHVFRNSSVTLSMTYLVLGVPAAFYTRSPELVVLAWFVALIAGICIALFAPMTRERPAASGRVKLSQLVGRSVSVHIGVSGQQLLFRADIVVLGMLTTASAVGLYSVAAPLAGLVWVATEALSLLAFDEGLADPRGRSDSLARISRLNLVVSMASAAVIGILSVLLLPRILPEFSEALPLLLILLPGVVVQGYARIALSHLATRDRTRAVLWLGVFSAFLSLLYIPFILIGGVVGAAVGSTCIYGVQAATVWMYMRRQSRREITGE